MRSQRPIVVVAILSLLVCMSGGSSPSFAAGTDGPTEINLEKQTHFATPGGETAVVAAGVWRVEATGDALLRLVPEDGDLVGIAASAMSHSEDLAGPLAFTVAGADATLHLVVLFPDGTGLAAVGFTSEVMPRGSGSLGPDQIKDGVATRGAGKSTSRAASLTKTGRFFLGQRTAWGHGRAIRYFETALRADSRYAPAESGLADANTLLYLHVEPKPEYLTNAKKHARRAVQFAPKSSQAQASTGLVKNVELDLTGALQAFELALELDPRNGVARQWYAETLMKSGDIDKSLTQIAKAVSQEPRSAVRQGIAGRLNQIARRYDAAILHGARAQKLNPDLPAFFRMSLSYAYWAKKRQPEAIDALLLDPWIPFSKKVALRGIAKKQGLSALVNALFAAQVSASGKPCTNVPSIGATMLAFLEQKRKALDCLEVSMNEGGAPSYYKLDPILDPIRNDPRFAKIVTKRSSR